MKKGDLSPRELNLMNKRLDRLVQYIPDDEDVEGIERKENIEKEILKEIEDFNAGRKKIEPIGETFEEKKQSVLDAQNEQIKNIVNKLKTNLGIGEGKEKISGIKTKLEQKVEQKLFPERMEKISRAEELMGEELTETEQKFASQFNAQKSIRIEKGKIKAAENNYRQKLQKATGNLEKQKQLLDNFRDESEQKLKDFEERESKKISNLWEKFFQPRIDEGIVSNEQAMTIVEKEMKLLENNIRKLQLENLATVSDFRDQIKEQQKKGLKAQTELEKIQEKKERIEKQKQELEFTPGQSKYRRPKFKPAVIPKSESEFIEQQTPRRGSIQSESGFIEQQTPPRRFSIQEVESPQSRRSSYRDWETDRKSTRLNSSH